MIVRGSVGAVAGGTVEVVLPRCAVGRDVVIENGARPLRARIAGFRGARAIAAPYGTLDGIEPGMAVRSAERSALALGTSLLGRAIDANGEALDGYRTPRAWGACRRARACLPGARAPIERVFATGVRAIDALCTLGRGARVGIFGAPGAGKSSLIAHIVRDAHADAVVVALAGERGREARDWIALLDARTTIVCATGDRSAAERVCAAEIAFAQAEALRARGLDVLLVLDSVARVAAALRELGVAAGEATGRGGYPAGVFAALARLLERAGAFHDGSITLVATVLSDGDERDPVSEAVRSLLDGHLQLETRLAQRGIFPAIDVLASTSRTMSAVVTPGHAAAAARVRAALGLLESTSEARALGIEATDPALLGALAAQRHLHALLAQPQHESSPYADTLRRLLELADTLEEAHGH